MYNKWLCLYWSGWLRIENRVKTLTITFTLLQSHLGGQYYKSSYIMFCDVPSVHLLSVKRLTYSCEQLEGGYSSSKATRRYRRGKAERLIPNFPALFLPLLDGLFPLTSRPCFTSYIRLMSPEQISFIKARLSNSSPTSVLPQQHLWLSCISGVWCSHGAATHWQNVRTCLLVETFG